MTANLQKNMKNRPNFFPNGLYFCKSYDTIPIVDFKEGQTV